MVKSVGATGAVGLLVNATASPITSVTLSTGGSGAGAPGWNLFPITVPSGVCKLSGCSFPMPTPPTSFTITVNFATGESPVGTVVTSSTGSPAVVVIAFLNVLVVTSASGHATQFLTAQVANASLGATHGDPLVIPVMLFNANTLSVNVTINQGPQHWIGPTNAGLLWRPVSFAGLTMNPVGAPTQDVFGLGANAVSIVPQGSTAPTSFNVNLPGGGQWTSLQFYIFFDTVETTSWLALDNGQYRCGSINPS